jgi:ABC-type uncharacterized transport system substrate-binding protein
MIRDGLLVALARDAILADSTPIVTALRGVTVSILVVFAGANDPVGYRMKRLLPRYFFCRSVH